MAGRGKKLVALTAGLVASVGCSTALGDTTKTVGMTFSNPAPIMIPDAIDATQPGVAVTTPISVSGFNDALTRSRTVNVYLHGLTHTAPTDLAISLVSPTGRTETLMRAVGGVAPVSNLELQFARGVPPLIPANGPLTSGLYSPSGAAAGDVSLSQIADSGLNGNWSLRVSDIDPDDTGMIARGWSLGTRGPVTFPPGQSPLPRVIGQKVDRRKGTVMLTLAASAAGIFSAEPGARTNSAFRKATAPGTYVLTVKADSRARKILRRKGRLKTRVTISFTQDGDFLASTSTVDVVLKMKRKRQRR